MCGDIISTCMGGATISVWLPVQYLCGWQYNICVVAGTISVRVGGDTISVWVVLQYRCGCRYNICVVEDTISVCVEI